METFNSLPWYMVESFKLSVVISCITGIFLIAIYVTNKIQPIPTTMEIMEKENVKWTLILYCTPYFNLVMVAFTSLFTMYQMLRPLAWAYIRNDVAEIHVDGADNMIYVLDSQEIDRPYTTYRIRQISGSPTYIMTSTYSIEGGFDKVDASLEDDDLPCLLNRWNEIAIADYPWLKRWAFAMCRYKLP